jgi:hypothetical protein
MLGVEVVASVPSGAGTITSSPSGLDCSSANSGTSGCQATFSPGTKVTLTATGASGDDKKNPPTAWTFVGSWGATNNAGIAVMGGPGSDRITSTTPGKSLIEGGPGHDVLISRRGRTVINAEDGAGGDMIICAPGSRATVVKDRGDIVRGPCTVRRGQ